ncbi:MAG: hypothetical protein P4L99_03040 [Chthoniobacter sp.]|nr:hypothetical protein [Chthoniobacter sp.]
MRGDKPPWLDDIKLIVFLHCQHWTGYVHNSFDDLAEAIIQLGPSMTEGGVMFVVLGWEGPYYRHPLASLAPAQSLGGHDAFSRLCETAKDVGGRLLLFSPLCVADVECVEREGWERGVLKRPWGETAWMNWCDWDGDLENEGYPFMNMGFEPFRKYLIEKYTRLIEQYPIDGLYFDITNYWEDDLLFDHLEGTRSLVAELHKAFPDVVCCGENWYDQLLGIFPFFGEPGNIMGPYDCMLRYCRGGAYVASPSPLGSGGVHEKGRGYLGAATLKECNVPYITIAEDWRDCIATLASRCAAAQSWSAEKNSVPAPELTRLFSGEIV